MSDFQAIADRVEIEALRGEYTDAVMMRDYDRVALLFTPDGALRMPKVPVDLVGLDQIRAWGDRVPAFGLDVLDPASVRAALADCGPVDVAYYLVDRKSVV